MSEVIRLSRKELKDIKAVNLHVFATNKPAISLHKKMGFKIVGRTPKQRSYEGKLIDELIMIKYL